MIDPFYSLESREIWVYLLVVYFEEINISVVLLRCGFGRMVRV